jgi:hypothetical protein
VPNCSAGRWSRSAVGIRSKFRQIVKVWILIHNDGVVLNRNNKYRNEDNVAIGSQCIGINSAEARAQIYLSSALFECEIP